MNDEAFFNALNSISNKSFICNDTRLKGDTGDFDSFYKQLLLLGYGYVVEKSVKYDGGNSKYRFTHECGDIPIEFMGCPFIIKNHVYYKCINGPQIQPKVNYLTHDHPTSAKKKYSFNSTKKFNCSAFMIMVKLTCFPEYQIAVSSLTKWRVKKQILADLKKDIDMGKEIIMTDKYFIILSLPSVHNHSLETSLLNLPLDKSVRDEIARLVNNGISNVKIVQTMLKDFVEQSHTTVPSHLSRAFFPNEQTI